MCILENVYLKSRSEKRKTRDANTPSINLFNVKEDFFCVTFFLKKTHDLFLTI